MSAVSLCVICEKPLDEERRRRSDAVTCSKRCRTALWRARRKARRNGGVPLAGATRDGYGTAASFEPPRPGAFAADRAEERFRAQLSRQTVASHPLTAEERELLAVQGRNPGVLIPALRDKYLERELERIRRESAETSQFQPLRVENQFDPSTYGSVARRAIQSRQRNRPHDPNLYALRPPSQSGPRPIGDIPECIDAPWSPPW